MKGYRFIILISLSVLFAAVSCGKEDPDQGKTYTKEDTVSPTDPVMGELTDSEIAGTAIAAGTTAAGIVTDLNTKKGIPGVPVTDGYSWCKTDANGVYQLTAHKNARKIYITTPSTYKIGLNSDGYPNFYCKKNIEEGKKYRIDFALEPLDAPETEFKLIMIGDPQCPSTGDVSRYVSETIRKIKMDATGDVPAYAMTLGDIIFDSNPTWQPMYQSMKKVKAGDWIIPFFQTIGNHDHDATLVKASMDRETMQYVSQTNFVKFFGPQDYSFDRGNVHIVSMDDVWVYGTDTSSKSNGQTCKYYSGFTNDQYNWLAQDVANVENPQDKVFIICCHVPFRGGGSSNGSNLNKDKHYSDVLALMKQFKEAHIMIGHTHYSQNYIHTGTVTKGGQPVYEHIHGSACGAWWSCNTSVTGAPNGYTMYDVKGSSIVNWQSMNSNFDNDFQLRVFDGNQEWGNGYKLQWSNTANKVGSGSYSAPGFAAAAGAFVAEVWNDDASNWKVEFWQNGKKVGNFTRAAASGICNIPLVAYWFNQKNKNSDTYVNKTASHIWYYKPASGIPSAETNWEVRAVHTVAASGQVNTYTADHLTTDYSTY